MCDSHVKLNLLLILLTYLIAPVEVK